MKSVSPQRKARSVSLSPVAQGVSLLAALVLGGRAVGCSDGVAHSDCASLTGQNQPLRVTTWWNAPDYPPIRVLRDGCGADPVDAGAFNGSGAEAQAGEGLSEGEVECENDPMILQRVLSVSFKGEDEQCQSVDEKEAVMTLLEQQAKDIEDRGGPQLADLAITNFGADLDRLVCDAELPALAPLGAWGDRNLHFITDRIPEFLQDLVTCADGMVYGAVLGLHQLNTMLFNRRYVGGDYNITAGKDILQLAQDAKDRGMPRPIVVVDEGWTWSLLVVENIMVATVKSERYVKFWKQLYPKEGGDRDQYDGLQLEASPEDTSLDMTPFEDALDAALALVPFMQVVDTRKKATDAISGDNPTAAITIMGDWVVPDLDPIVVGSRPFPGTEQYYVFNGDMISVTWREDFSLGDPAMGVMKAVTSPRLQDLYSPTKNSVSVVTNRGGKEVAKSEEEIFRDEQGNPREGVRGLPALIPSKRFKHLQDDIQALMVKAIHGYFDEAKEPGSNPDVQGRKDTLLANVRREFCDALENQASGCREGDTPKPAR